MLLKCANISGAAKFNNGEAALVSNTLSWDVSKVTRTQSMFYNAAEFNSNLSGWDLGEVYWNGFMFRNSNWNNGASAGVSTTLSWNVEKVINMKSMFRDNSAFNANISAWNPLSVVSLYTTFHNATAFNNGFPAGSAGTATISNTLDWNMPSLTSQNTRQRREWGLERLLMELPHLIRI